MLTENFRGRKFYYSDKNGYNFKKARKEKFATYFLISISFILICLTKRQINIFTVFHLTQELRATQCGWLLNEVLQSK